jgi:glycosyltransferase 2 family protein
VGTFQLAVKYGLLLFLPASVANSSGLAFANVLWACQTVQQVGLGFILMVSGHLSFREIARNLSAGEGASPEVAS